ncbi:unnamed protein product [Lampetra fluviatilis]
MSPTFTMPVCSLRGPEPTWRAHKPTPSFLETDIPSEHHHHLTAVRESRDDAAPSRMPENATPLVRASDKANGKIGWVDFGAIPSSVQCRKLEPKRPRYDAADAARTETKVEVPPLEFAVEVEACGGG